VREHQLLDDEAAIISVERQRRIAAELLESLLRNLPGIDPAVAKACANNLAAGFGWFGVKED